MNQYPTLCRPIRVGPTKNWIAVEGTQSHGGGIGGGCGGSGAGPGTTGGAFDCATSTAALQQYSYKIASSAPRIPATSVEDRNVFAIYVSYYIKVKLTLSAMGGEVTLKLPFILGHVEDVAPPIVAVPAARSGSVGATNEPSPARGSPAAMTSPTVDADLEQPATPTVRSEIETDGDGEWTETAAATVVTELMKKCSVGKTNTVQPKASALDDIVVEPAMISSSSIVPTVDGDDDVSLDGNCRRDSGGVYFKSDAGINSICNIVTAQVHSSAM